MAVNPKKKQKSRTLTLFKAMTLFAALATAVQTSAQITTFEAPGAGKGSGLGTSPIGINLSGAIAGYYTDSTGEYHGFLRTPDGTITKINPRGSTSMHALGLNSEGAIVGDYYDSAGTLHGYLRAPNGTITTFDAPGRAQATAKAPMHKASTISG